MEAKTKSGSFLTERYSRASVGGAVGGGWVGPTTQNYYFFYVAPYLHISFGREIWDTLALPFCLFSHCLITRLLYHSLQKSSVIHNSC